MPKPVIHVIGLGVSQSADLSAEALKVLQSSQQVIGWERHQAIVAPLLHANTFVVVQKLSQLKAEIKNFLSQLQSEPQSQANQQAPSICIVASGDPLHYGIGRWLCKQLDQLPLRGVTSSPFGPLAVSLLSSDAWVLQLPAMPSLSDQGTILIENWNA